MKIFLVIFCIFLVTLFCEEGRGKQIEICDICNKPLEDDISILNYKITIYAGTSQYFKTKTVCSKECLLKAIDNISVYNILPAFHHNKIRNRGPNPHIKKGEDDGHI